MKVGIVSETDVMSCLCYPTLEGGSASLILALLSGHPTLVSDHASYVKVPDGLVLKCPLGHEAAAVLHHLETILGRDVDTCKTWSQAHSGWFPGSCPVMTAFLDAPATPLNTHHSLDVGGGPFSGRPKRPLAHAAEYMGLNRLAALHQDIGPLCFFGRTLPYTVFHTYP